MPARTAATSRASWSGRSSSPRRAPSGGRPPSSGSSTGARPSARGRSSPAQSSVSPRVVPRRSRPSSPRCRRSGRRRSRRTSAPSAASSRTRTTGCRPGGCSRHVACGATGSAGRRSRRATRISSRTPTVRGRSTRSGSWPRPVVARSMNSESRWSTRCSCSASSSCPPCRRRYRRGEVRAMARGRELTAGRARTRASAPALELLPSGRSIAVETEPAGHSRTVERALRPIEGTSLLKIDEGTITRRLEALPHVHLLGYDRSFPDGLRVYVSVERPVAVLRRADENWLVSGEGRVLRKLDVRLRRPLPVVWIPRSFEPEVGVIIRPDEPSRAVAALGSLRSAAPKFYGRIWYVAPADHGLTLVLRDHFEIRLGDAAELELKLEVARHVLAAIRQIGSPATYVDVSVPARPVVGTTLNSQVEP